MKRLILLFVLFFNIGVFAQKIEYSIIVKDIETQLPIENAAVFILKTKQTLISNKERKINFYVDRRF